MSPGLQMKTLSTMVMLSIFLAWTSNAMGQMPSIQDLTRNIDQAASNLSEQSSSILGFKKLQMPKPLEGLLDIRFKKPQLPSFGLLEKLKGIGQPQIGAAQQPATGPILSGLAKLFPPKQNANQSFLEKMFGTPARPSSQSLLGATDMSELTRATQGLQDHVGRMSRDVRTTATDLFNGQQAGSSLQPPLQSARQYSPGQTQTRY